MNTQGIIKKSASHSYRRRRIATAPGLLAALAVALIPAPIAAARHAAAPAPVLSTIPVGRADTNDPPLFAVDQDAGRAYLVAHSSPARTGSIKVLDNATGRLLGAFAGQGQPPITDLALAPRAHHLFVGTDSLPTVRVLDSATGWLVRTLSVRPYDRAAALAVDDTVDRLYVAAVMGMTCLAPRPACTLAVLSFDTRTGARLRAVALPVQEESYMGLAVDSAAHRLILAHAALFLPPARIPLPYDATTGIEKVAVFDTARGRLVRQTTLPVHDRMEGFLGDIPVVDAVSGRAFLVVAHPSYYPEDGRLADHAALVFDTRTGARLRAAPLGPGAAQLAVDGRTGAVFAAVYGPLRRVIVSDAPGLLPHPAFIPVAGGGGRQLDPRTGAVLRTIVTGAATTAVAIDSRRGRVYVANAGLVDARGRYAGPGVVSVLDERTGAVLRRFAVAAGPLRLAVDERRQRLFVAAGANGPTGGGVGTVSVVDTAHLP